MAAGLPILRKAMGRITEESIQKVMATVDIVDLINGYVPLKRAGTTFKACCPFHSERTPSFSVTPSRNTFHCFGCGKGGGSVRFVMEYENLPFADAVRKLAAKYNIPIVEEAGTPQDDAERSLKSRLTSLHRDITAWFHELLLRNPGARAARDYLRGRGINSEIAKRWMIGYAPQDAALYRDWLRGHKYSETLLVQAGIFVPRDEGMPERGGYPRFKHRVMFPIRNDHGDVIAFSGRILDVEASPAKYINSPETPIFKKSQVFFGLDMAKRAIHKEQLAVICEGQIDMIMCYESGIENIVAPLGTAFTPDHARLLKRHTEQVTLCYDSDKAGIKAAHSCFAELAREGLYVRVAAMPAGDDPDSLIRRDGVEALKEMLANARDFVDFQIDQRLPDLDPANVRERMKLLKDVTASIARIRERIVQETFLNRAALKLGVPVQELRSMVTAHAREMLRHMEQAKERDEQRAASGQQPLAHVGFEPDSPYEEEDDALIIENAAMRQLLHLALCSAEARDWLRQNTGNFPWAAITGGDLLCRALQAELDTAVPATVNAWMAQLPAAEEIALAPLLHMPMPGEGVENAELALVSLRIQAINSRLSILNERQRQYATAREQIMAAAAEIFQLQQELSGLQRRMREMKVDG